MPTKKTNIDPDGFDKLLAIAGYTIPRNDNELELFESYYVNYKSKLKGVRINPKEIIDRSFSRRRLTQKIDSVEEKQDINEIRLAARNGSEEIPQSIIDKMKRKHKDGDK